MFNLGDKVTAPGQLRRKRDGRQKFWSRFDWGEPVVGIYIGYRTYSNGFMDGGYSYEEQPIFIPENYIKVALIVTNPRLNPTPVLFSEVSHV